MCCASTFGLDLFLKHLQLAQNAFHPLVLFIAVELKTVVVYHWPKKSRNV